MALHHCVGNTISIRAPTRGATTNADRIRSMTDISIRAPARGATVAYELRDSMTRISIRAPARGATSRSVHTRRRINHFNPRSHEGSDADLVCNVSRIFISIRAPTRGATRFRASSKILPTISIRAPTRGATSCCSLSTISSKFQSALPRGERPLGIYRYKSIISISIRAPARGATLRREIQRQLIHNFNPRSREGSDPSLSAV